jgi:ribosome-associated toxin RatA of RatAB toxin-antitoxin module
MKAHNYIKHQRNLMVFAFLLVNLSFTSSIDWELKKSSKGIFVYTKQGPNSGIKEVKCVTNFQSSLKNLVCFIKDIKAHPQYIYQCKNSFIIKNVNDSELYYYHETETPWPVANRYGVIYYKITQNNLTKVVNIKSNGVLGMYPNQPNLVEVPALTATWTFTPKSDGTVDGVYYLYLNPGGNIPIWLINMFVVDGPFLTILKMKELLQTEKYNDCKVHFIKN